MTQRHAEIAGGGFAGLAAAIALRKRGWTVRVHEMDKELRSFGAGIFVWSNGLRVLRAVDAYDETVNGAHETPFSETRNERNEKLQMDHFGPDRGSRMLTMTRQHLFSAMLSAAKRAGVDFLTSSEAVAAEPAGVLITADGRKWPADLVIGADGVKSKVRDSLNLLGERQRYDQEVIRLLVERGPNDLNRDGADNVINFWSPRHRILYVPCSKTELYLLFGAASTDAESIRLPLNKKVWMAAFPFMADIIDRVGEQGRSDPYEMHKLVKWSSGKVAIVGDASHAMPPTIGQGAGTAMMNALALTVALENEGDIEAGLKRWEAKERPLTEHTQDISCYFAQNRTGSDGTSKWDEPAMRTARCIPTGTEQMADQPA